MANDGAAFVLHVRPWRETSLLLEVLTREGGRRGVVARGGRSNAQHRARLQLFRPLWLELGGRGELAQLRRVEETQGMAILQGRTLICGYYLNELLMRLLPRDDAHPTLFDAYAAAIDALASAAGQEAAVLRRFEKNLLEELGWAPDWCHTMQGDAVEASAMYRVDTEQGICLAGQGEARCVRGQSLLHLAAHQFNEPATAREIRLILQSFLAAHLGSKPLQSRELLKLDMEKHQPTHES